MGSWSSKPFGNDTALDWLAGLTDAEGERLIESAIERACRAAEPLDAPEAEQAVAAVAVVAAACAEPICKVPDEVKAWIERRGYVPGNALIERSVRALDVVVERSELRELWAESDALAGWVGATADVRKRLTAAKKRGLPERAHVHFHCCVIDGVFTAGEGEQVQFCEAAALTSEDLATVQQQVRARVLRWFARAGHLDPGDWGDTARRAYWPLSGNESGSINDRRWPDSGHRRANPAWRPMPHNEAVEEPVCDSPG